MLVLVLMLLAVVVLVVRVLPFLLRSLRFLLPCLLHRLYRRNRLIRNRFVKGESVSIATTESGGYKAIYILLNH
jgi:hypothetical protein